MTNYILVTDGSIDSPHYLSHGGYGYRLSSIDSKGNRELLYEGGGSLDKTTNNKMEMMAIRDGLVVAYNHFHKFGNSKEDNLIVISDSDLCVLSLTKYIYSWLRNQKDGVLYKSNNKPVENQDVIKPAYEMLSILKSMMGVYVYHINSHVNKNTKHRIDVMNKFMKKNNCLMSIELFNNIIEENDLVDGLAKSFMEKGRK